MKNLILVLFIISFFSCANTKNNTSNTSSQDTLMNYEELAKQKVNFTNKAEEKFECIENTNKTFVLCKNTVDGTRMQPRNSISFVVYNMKTNELVYESYVNGGSVSWYETNRIARLSKAGKPTKRHNR